MSRRRWLAFLIVAVFPFAVITSTLPTPQANQDSEAYLDGWSGNLNQEPGASHEIYCSRERSRAASRIIKEYLMPFVEKENYKLPSKCRLLLENDLYGDQEQHKKRRDIDEWQCGYCRKMFSKEKYLDLHFVNRHYNLLNVSHSNCLADLCGALRCDAAMDLKKKKKKKNRCNPAAAARNKHLCEGLADNCFPVKEGPSASRLHEFFLRQFCDAHTCSGQQKRVSIARRGRSIFWNIITVLLVVLLSLSYLFLYLHRRGLKRGAQNLKRVALKKKPS